MNTRAIDTPHGGHELIRQPEAAGVSPRLRAQMKRTERRAHVRAILFVTPLVLFLIFFFLVPIAFMLHFGIHSPDFQAALPRFTERLAQNPDPVPDEEVYAVLAEDLWAARQKREHGKAIKPLRHQSIEVWRLFNAVFKELPARPQTTYRDWFLAQSPRWGEADVWSMIRRVSQPYTAFYLLNSIDAERTADGAIVRKPAEQRLYLGIARTTFEISFWVTVVTLLLGYPFAHLLATTREPTSSILMVLVLIPFWTSLLVRTYAWLMLLQTEGVVNSIVTGLGLAAEPLALIHNRLGVYIAMVHILLPFMILPIYSVMRGIRPDYMRAAAGLGASPVQAFLTVYLPQSLPGIAAGCLLVFIFSLGFYITPALVGGPQDSMISIIIAYNVNQVLNWGMAGALGTLLLVATLVIFVVYTRLLGLEKLRLN